MSSKQQGRSAGEAEDPMEIDDNQNQNPQDIIELGDSDDEEDRKLPSRVRDHNHVASNSPGNISQRRRRRRIGSLQSTPTNNLPPAEGVINLVDSPPPAAAGATSTTAAAASSSSNSNDEWSCPQCTLLNATNRSVCEACHYRNPNILRPPDASFRDQLIPDDPPSGFMYSQTRYGNPTTTSSSDANPQGAAMFLSGGALLGGMMGAAGSLMNGRPVLSSAAQGAMTGAVSGAFIHEVLQNTSPSQQDEMAAARSSAAMGLAGYPSMMNSELLNSYDDDNAPPSSRRRARPRASYRVFEEQDPRTGATTTVVQAGPSTTRMMRRSTRSSLNRGNGMTDPLLSMLVHSYLQEQGRHGSGTNINPDNMNYEELLQAFGNGNENMGASEREIGTLPCRCIENPEQELPEEARECLICLEDFQQGETRMTLPCLHGFHKECAQKWLRTNGSCPICKHKISNNS